MDIIKRKKLPLHKRRKVYIPAGGLAFSGLLFASLFLNLNEHAIGSSEIITAVVQRGEFALKISAPGILAPQFDRWLSSTVEGKVNKIFVRPGAMVARGDVIVELYNPNLKQHVQELTWELAAMEADGRALKEQHATRLLEMESQMLQNKMDYEREKIRLDAESELIKSGNSTVPKIEYESRKLTVSQLEQTIDMDEMWAAQLKSTLSAELEANHARISRLRNQLERAETQLADLVVEAPFSGVLQTLELELGEQVLVGTNIAKVVKDDDLIAELSVAEFKASSVALGQKVVIDTRTSKIEGQVVRIDPAVIDGTVKVDIALEGILPSEARADLSIDGEIFISEKPDSLYVRRPAFSQERQKMSVFKLDQKKRHATQTVVQFGASSSIDIEVLDGVKEGDVIIISEVDDFNRFEKVIIN